MSFTRYFHRFHAFTRLYPISRGMIAYSVIWPASNLCQQTIAGFTSYDFPQATRFGIYGTFYVAPTLYMWVKIAGAIMPAVNFRTAVVKALIEQVTYGPFAIASFYTGITLLEGRGVEQVKLELKEKFLPTWKAGLCVWPILQTINFTYIREKNRVAFVSGCSLMWTTFLSYMKQKELKALKEKSEQTL